MPFDRRFGLVRVSRTGDSQVIHALPLLRIRCPNLKEDAAIIVLLLTFGGRDDLLAATLFAHDPAVLGVHVMAGLGDDGVAGPDGRERGWSGWVVAGSVWFAEQAGKRGDGFEQ
jgi:hypothetical protein